MAPVMATRNDIHGESTPGLMAGLLGDFKDLAAGHLSRTRHEMGSEMTELKMTLMRVVIAVGVLSVGAMLLGHAIVAGLVAAGLPAWASYLLVSAVGIGIAVFLLVRWKPNREAVDLIPEESIEKMADDVKQISDAARH
jgi:hypothetical protein